MPLRFTPAMTYKAGYATLLTSYAIGIGMPTCCHYADYCATPLLLRYATKVVTPLLPHYAVADVTIRVKERVTRVDMRGCPQ